LIRAVLVLLVLAQEARSPVPDAKAEREAEKLVRELFKDAYAKKAPGLAKTLLDQALQTRDSAVNQYVLLRESRDVALQAGDLPAAFQAVDEMGRRFQLNPRTMKADILEKLGKSAKTPEESGRVAKAAVDVADELVAADEYAAAEKLTTQAMALARKAKEVPVVTRLDSKIREMGEAKQRWEKGQRARDALAADPASPAANLAVGRYLCFVKGQWESGLQNLVRAGDGPLKTLCLRDIAGPKESAGQIEVGDGWWDLAEKEPAGIEQATIRRRAAHWYVQAAPRVAGAARAGIEKRLGSIGEKVPAFAGIDLLKMVNPAQDNLRGAWKVQEGVLISPAKTDEAQVQIPYLPGPEYDLRIVVSRKEGEGAFSAGLGFLHFSFLVTLDAFDGRTGGIDAIDRERCDANPSGFKRQVFTDDKPRTLLYSVRESGVTLLVDGQKVLSWDQTWERLSLPAAWIPPHRGGLFLMTWGSAYHVKEITLFPDARRGKPLR
jgi:hypothetical protein